jgi:hypothetical protein
MIPGRQIYGPELQNLLVILIGKKPPADYAHNGVAFIWGQSSTHHLAGINSHGGGEQIIGTINARIKLSSLYFKASGGHHCRYHTARYVVGI